MPNLKSVVYQVTRAAAAVAFLSLCMQVYMGTIFQDIRKDDFEDPMLSSFPVNATKDPAARPTLWELIRNDDRISRFADIVSQLPREKSLMASSGRQYTIFAPIDEAFQKEIFAWDLPDFYWMFLAQYHISMHGYSGENLAITETIPTMIWADIYQTNPQRMSTQISSAGTLKFSHRSSIIESNLKASNGYLHIVDRILMLPRSTAEVLRSAPEFSTFQKGLVDTGLIWAINDTATHNGQTVFAPSNTAFERLGTKVNDFLFSTWGSRCLRALLEYHVVGNQTLFTNTYFRANGRGPGQVEPVSPGFETNLSSMIPPLHIKVNVEKSTSRNKIKINDAIDVSQPDIVVQDGVIHRIDSILLPPKASLGENDSGQNSFMETIRAAILGPRIMTVEELMQRFESHLE